MLRLCKLVALIAVAVSDDASTCEFELRISAYSRQQKSKPHRRADFTRCVLLTVHRLSTANTHTQLQVQAENEAYLN